MILTYRNPVWPHELADPFVLRWQGNYYAYGTSSFSRDRIFQVLRSPDLVPKWSTRQINKKQ